MSIPLLLSRHSEQKVISGGLPRHDTLKLFNLPLRILWNYRYSMETIVRLVLSTVSALYIKLNIQILLRNIIPSKKRSM